MSTVSRFNTPAEGLTPEEEIHANFLQRVKASAKYFYEQKILAYSKMADGAATSIGTQLRGVGRKISNAAFALLGKSSFLTTVALLSNNNKFFGGVDSLKYMPPRFASTAPNPTTTAPASGDLTNAFTCEVGMLEIDATLAQKFEEHVVDTKLQREAIATHIADNTFIGPLRPEMLELRDAFTSGAISEEELVAEATKQLLKYNGIIFSTTGEFALSQDTFDTLNIQFKDSSSDGTPAQATIFIFNNAALQPETRQESEAPAHVLK